MKFYDNENAEKTLEVEICENGSISISINSIDYEYPETFELNEEESNKFIKQIETIKNIVEA